MKIREFPALLMTTLIAVASLTATASLRNMSRQTRPDAYSRSNETQGYESEPEFQLARGATSLKTLSANN